MKISNKRFDKIVGDLIESLRPVLGIKENITINCIRNENSILRNGKYRYRAKNLCGYTTYFYRNKEVNMYIFVCSIDNLKELKLTVVHEMLHVYNIKNKIHNKLGANKEEKLVLAYENVLRKFI